MMKNKEMESFHVGFNTLDVKSGSLTLEEKLALMREQRKTERMRLFVSLAALVILLSAAYLAGAALSQILTVVGSSIAGSIITYAWRRPKPPS